MEVTMTDPAAEMAGDAVDLQAGQLVATAIDRVAQLGAEPGIGPLVRIDDHHPVVARERYAVALLLDVTRVRSGLDDIGTSEGELLAAVATRRVDDDDDLVREGTESRQRPSECSSLQTSTQALNFGLIRESGPPRALP